MTENTGGDHTPGLPIFNKHDSCQQSENGVSGESQNKSLSYCGRNTTAIVQDGVPKIKEGGTPIADFPLSYPRKKKSAKRRPTRVLVKSNTRRPR